MFGNQCSTPLVPSAPRQSKEIVWATLRSVNTPLLVAAILLFAFTGCDNNSVQMTASPNKLPDVPVILIDESRMEHYLDTGYNPAVYTDTFTKEQYIDEWYSFFNKLKENVATHWDEGIGDKGDFFMDSDWVPHRFVCIEVSTQRMLTPQLLNVVHQSVVNSDADYSVDICNDWVFFEHPDFPDGNVGPYFYIFVEKNQILIYSKSPEILDKLGITPEG